MPSNKAQILIRTSDETKEILTRLADKEKRSLSNYIEVILENYIANINKSNNTVNIEKSSDFNINM